MAKAIAFLVLLLISPAAYAAIVGANVGASAPTAGAPSAPPPSGDGASATIGIEDEQLPILETDETPADGNWVFVPEHSISFTLSNFIKYGGSLRLKLIVGQTLSIRFDRVTHAVYEVNQDDYNNCVYESPIDVYTSSPARIILSAVGTRYFIDRWPNNCNRGLKLAVNVQARRGAFAISVQAGSTAAGDAPPPSAPSPTS